jgi:alpha-tubulin suppressor-like RCC1 family protein
VSGWTGIAQVAAGGEYYGSHTVSLKSDGKASATGWDYYGQCDVGVRWRHITQVAAGGGHTVGLKDEATLVAAGDNAAGQCDVMLWANIVQVDAGYAHTVGLKTDGTVIAAGLEVELAKWRL